MDAAARLLESGRTPSISEVAAEAEVARRTVYLYFSTLEQLLVDAALGQISETTVDAELEAIEPLSDVEERVSRVVRAIQITGIETEHLGRTIIRLGTPQVPGEPATPSRGYRRVAWLERAAAPARDRMTGARWEQLISELTLLVGWEAMISLRDIRGLTPEQTVEVCVNGARALVRQALTG